ncbi:hypothetical protein SAMN02745172_02462 [Pseudoxanthobacter soli DSM 19599]|uniref:Uncharacterized protein n=1 Tax=Pseudoxanthobacter soli DSM 19599 TaxID=1123029 RepID=A0A1M7ZLP0_9HYPH|nr:phage tail assembly protein [Pseudoxanthobacter soli]SHO65815.1 hypothetical protein SAMN02745172_02462 [Pseudoxanthobacter soli DSM 19599]
MARTVTVTLSAPVLWHDQQVTDVRLREPTAADYFAHGDPVTMVYTAGAMVPSEDGAALRGYVGACLDHEGGDALLRLISLRDGIAIKRAILDFFEGARGAP